MTEAFLQTIIFLASRRRKGHDLQYSKKFNSEQKKTKHLPTTIYQMIFREREKKTLTEK